MLIKIYVHSFEDIPYHLYKNIKINTAIYDHFEKRKLLEFSVRVMNVFKEKNINTLKDILQIPEDEYLRLSNLGKKSLKEINSILNQFGLKILKTKDDVRRFFLIKQRNALNEIMDDIKDMVSTRNFIDY